VRDGKLSKLSRDHTMLEEYKRDHPSAKPDELSQVPRQDLVSRTLGQRPTVEVDVMIYDLRVEDRLVLGSEGVSAIGDSGILGAVTAKGTSVADLEAVVAGLIDRATLRKVADSTTVVIGFVKKS
jgi:serine/threonine protein phosphatase PrpC